MSRADFFQALFDKDPERFWVLHSRAMQRIQEDTQERSECLLTAEEDLPA